MSTPVQPIVIDKTPLRVDLRPYGGDDLALSLEVTDTSTGQPFDLSATTAHSQVRDKPGGQVLAEFAVTITGNVIILHLTGEQVANLPARAVWDVQIGPPAPVITLAAGRVTTTADVTRLETA